MLRNRVVCVTGATSGFGWEIAVQAARAGAAIVAMGRRAERLAALKEALPEGALFHPVTLDVRDNSAVQQSFAELSGTFREIYALINNAGLALGTLGAPHALMADWEQMVDTNIKGLMYCTQAALPGMVARGAGHVVNIGSIAGSYPYKGGNAYGGTKAFVKQFSANLRTDLLGTKLRVTLIEPGMAETEFSLVRYQGDQAKADAVYQGILPLTATDVADAVMWALTRPEHVNINRIELMPVMQAAGGLAVHRNAG